MRHWDADTPKTNVVKTQNMTKTTNQNHEHDQPIFEINKHEITSHPPIPQYSNTARNIGLFFSLCWINIIKKQKKKLWIIVFNIQKLPITQYEVFIIEVYNELSRVNITLHCCHPPLLFVCLLWIFHWFQCSNSTWVIYLRSAPRFTFHDTPEKQFQTQQSS